MEEIYRGHRLSIRATETGWQAKVWSVRGPLTTITALANAEEGSDACLQRTRIAVDQYLAYMQHTDR